LLSTQSNKEVILYADIEYIDKDSKLISHLKYPHYSSENFRPAFIKDGIINGCTLLVPKICFEKCGLFKTNLRTTQDYELWFRISEKYQFSHQPQILIHSRLHENQDTLILQRIVVEEKDNLHLYFLKNISEEEIIRFSKENPTGYYIAFAFQMESSKCKKARKVAINRAYKNLFKSNLSRIIQNTFKLLLLLIIILGAKRLFDFLFGFTAYLKLKKAIRLFFKSDL